MIRHVPVLIAVAACLAACKAEPTKTSPAVPSALRALHARYKAGSIDQCKHAGKLTYIAGLNAPDAAPSVYDQDGNTMGRCNFAENSVDPICGQLQDCQTVYRCADHITGEPPVDTYGLND